GRAVWYVRIGKGPRMRIKAEYGTTEFDEEYRAALDGAPLRRNAAPAVSTLAWLVARYRETNAWSNLSVATRKRRDRIFKIVLETAGHEAYSSVTTASIEAGRERRANTPHEARHFLDAMRGLFRWAKPAGFVASDPTAGVKNPVRKGTAGFIPWTEEHVVAYHERWPRGTRERVWLDVLLYTGLRRGDAVRVGRQHVGSFIKTEKSGHNVEVPVIILPELRETLDAGPCGDLTFIVGTTGQPFTKESFGNKFRAACRAAGVPGSAHGVRKLAATRMAENGATEAQLMAVFGWTEAKMPTLYTRSANRRRLATESIEKLNARRTLIPAPLEQVRGKSNKGE
ncbi:MAG: tyrosine-type recombinase/integrase, partial [Pseudomonadota bacterium]